jgi:GT2 family glycosyltransferase
MSSRLPTGIDIVIPNWNGKMLLPACLRSLQSQRRPEIHIIVVDNGSTDGSVSFIRDEFPWVEVISLPENRGFSAAVNAGIKAGSRPWVMLLNNDTEVHPDCLEALLHRCRRHGDVGMFALKMCGFERREVLDGAGDGVLRGGVGYRLGTMEIDGPEYALSREVFGACAGAALYRRSIFARIGLFDEEFFAYLEDVDFNFRAARAGVRCRYLPEAVVYHIGSASSGSKINSFVVRLSTRNNIFVIAKNYSPALLLRFLPALLVYQLFWLLFVIKKHQFVAYLQGLFQAAVKLPVIVRRRREPADVSRLCDRELARRVIESERQVVRSIMARRMQQGKGNLALRWYLRIFC